MNQLNSLPPQQTPLFWAGLLLVRPSEGAAPSQLSSPVNRHEGSSESEGQWGRRQREHRGLPDLHLMAHHFSGNFAVHLVAKHK